MVILWDEQEVLLRLALETVKTEGQGVEEAHLEIEREAAVCALEARACVPSYSDASHPARYSQYRRSVPNDNSISSFFYNAQQTHLRECEVVGMNGLRHRKA